MSPKSEITAANIRPSKRTGAKRAFANQERAAQVKRLGRMGRALLMLCATVLSFAAAALLAADQLYRPDAFVIDNLKIKGSFRYLDPRQIEDQVNGHSLGNFFSIGLSGIKQRVEALPLVQSAEVRREWPDTLLIEVKEQRPVMRWHADRWVNFQGDVISLQNDISLNNPIVLAGNDNDSREMLENALRWTQQLKGSGLELLGVVLTASHAYTLNIKPTGSQAKFDLLLGREQTEERLARFISLFEHQYRHGAEQLERVDARYPDGLAIKSSTIELDESIAFNNGMTDETKSFSKR